MHGGTPSYNWVLCSPTNVLLLKSVAILTWSTWGTVVTWALPQQPQVPTLCRCHPHAVRHVQHQESALAPEWPSHREISQVVPKTGHPGHGDLGSPLLRHLHSCLNGKLMMNQWNGGCPLNVTHMGYSHQQWGRGFFLNIKKVFFSPSIWDLHGDNTFHLALKQFF